MLPLTVENDKIGIVLSGGGIRGIAHVGLLQALSEIGIQPNYISGSSAGALVGALYAMGYDNEKILAAFTELEIYSYSRFTWRKLGFLDSETFIPHLQKFFPIDDFSALNIPLTVTMTDLERGICEYVSEGELVRPLIASAAYPPTLSPIQIGDHYYIDGGIMDNFPIRPLKNKVGVLIGSYVSPIQEVSYSDLSHSGQLAWRAINLSYYAGSEAKFEQCDYNFMPIGIEDIGTFDNKLVQKVYEMGYEQAKAALPDILRIIIAQKEALAAKEKEEEIDIPETQPSSNILYQKLSGILKSFY